MKCQILYSHVPNSFSFRVRRMVKSLIQKCMCYTRCTELYASMLIPKEKESTKGKQWKEEIGNNPSIVLSKSGDSVCAM
jgi:prolyl-tRNA synthetase